MDGLVVAWMLHLVVDQMWLHEAVLFWPFFGWDIVIPATGGFGRRPGNPVRSVAVGPGLVGLGYLAWLFAASGLREGSGAAHRHRTPRLSVGCRVSVAG